MRRVNDDAVELLPADADRAVWLAERQNGVGASEAATVLGISPWNSAFNLWHAKLGPVVEVESERFAWGHRLEAVVADHFADQHPEFAVVRVGVCAHTERGWQRATPDRLLYEAGVGEGDDPLSGLEIKTYDIVSDEWGPDGSDQIPAHYLAQVEQTMDVLGFDTYYLAVLFGGSHYREYPITRTASVQADIDLIREAGEAFWGQVVGGVEPDIDWRPATTRRLKALHPSVVDADVEIAEVLIAGRYKADLAVKAATRDRDAADNLVRAALGDYRTGTVGGVKAVSRSVYPTTRIDAKALRAAHPDIADQFTTTTETHRLTYPKPKEG